MRGRERGKRQVEGMAGESVSDWRIHSDEHAPESLC